MMDNINRQRWLAVGLVLVLVAAAAIAWAIYGRSSAQKETGLDENGNVVAGESITNHKADFQTKINATTVSKLSKNWMVTTADPMSHDPLFMDGNVYFADWGGTVYSVKESDGSMVWQKKIAEPKSEWPWHGFAGTGVLGNNMLYEADVEGDAFALDPKTGDVKWQKHFADNEYAGNVGPLAYNSADDLVYIGLQSVIEPLTKDKPDIKTDFQGGVVALKGSSGDVVWQKKLVLAPENGIAVWQGFGLDAATNTLFFGTGNNYTGKPTENSDALIAVNAKTGDIKWKKQTFTHDVWTAANPLGPDYDFDGPPQFFTLTQNGSARDVVGVAQKSGTFWVFDKNNGDEVWKTTISYGGELGGMHDAASIGKDKIFAWGNNNYSPEKKPEEAAMNITALGLDNGDFIWDNHKAQPAALTTAGLLANDVYLVPSLDGKIRGYSVNDGKKIWESSGDEGSIATDVRPHSNKLFFGVGVPEKFGGKSGNGMVAYIIK